jgi:hypothetical protein
MTRDEAVRLAADYEADEDEGALAAGRAIREGDLSPENLRIIYRWKTKDRGKSRLAQNSDVEIRDALRLAVSAETPRAAIAVLTDLYGVDTPVASAVMTVIRPERFTILDFRALEALGNPTGDRSVPFYLAYLGYCTDLASRWEMPLRQLDRALWQWSRVRSGAARG